MKEIDGSTPPTRQWLTLGQAARVLGIHPTTLRRWTDEGVLPCLRTPGGHRRFLQEDLDAFLQSQTDTGHHEPSGALVRSMIRQARHEIEAERIAETSWHAAFSEPERAERRKSGRRLLGLAIQFTSRTMGREALVQEACAIGHEYGRDAAERGLSLLDITQALMFFREALISAARPGLANRGEYDAEDIRIHRSLRQFLNQVFFAAMEGFEEGAQWRLLEDAR